jgi:uncharacterized protein with PIN domain
MTAPARHLTVVQTVVDDESGELAGCPSCRAALEEAETWEKRVLQLEQALKRATEDKDARLYRDKDYTAAHALFEEWQRECGHPNAKFDPARINLALRAIRRYGKDNRAALSMVIQHGKHLAWVNPKTGSKKDSFGLLFRDSDQIESRANEYARWRKRNPEAAA